MTKDKAVAITKALNDIEDFEFFMQQVRTAFYDSEGNLSTFYHDELMPVLKKELCRREAVLEEL